MCHFTLVVILLLEDVAEGKCSGFPLFNTSEGDIGGSTVAQNCANNLGRPQA